MTPTYWMPTEPGEKPQPAPSIMNEDMAIRFLGIQTAKEPRRTLGHWRRKGVLRGSYIAKGQWSYRLEDLLAFQSHLAGRGSVEVEVKPPTAAAGKQRRTRAAKAV